MVPIDEKMERARLHFLDRAGRATTPEDRTTNEVLAQMAVSIQESLRLLEHLKLQVDEVRHAIGLHLETSGPVPHTQRRRAERAVE